MLAERKKIGVIGRGEAAVTPAFDLKAKYVIHTVGPAWEGGDHGEFEVLRNCYHNSLEKAHELGCGSIAFPLIATGVYGFPKDEALRIAMNEISSFLMRDDVDMTVKLVVFDDRAFMLSRNLFFEVESFISDEDVIEAHREEYGISREEFDRDVALSRRRRREYEEFYPSVCRNEIMEMPPTDGEPVESVPATSRTGSSRSSKDLRQKPVQTTGGRPFNEDTFDRELYAIDDNEAYSFREHFLNQIIEKDLTNTAVYKNSNVTKGAFSKILSGETRTPKKKTVLAFCIGMRLTLEESRELLASGDMAFNPYNKRDRLVIQCITQKQR